MFYNVFFSVPIDFPQIYIQKTITIFFNRFFPKTNRLTKPPNLSKQKTQEPNTKTTEIEQTARHSTKKYFTHAEDELIAPRPQNALHQHVLHYIVELSARQEFTNNGDRIRNATAEPACIGMYIMAETRKGLNPPCPERSGGPVGGRGVSGLWRTSFLPRRSLEEPSEFRILI